MLNKLLQEKEIDPDRTSGLVDFLCKSPENK